MEVNINTILVINGGSSSIKFALYEMEEPLRCLWQGAIQGIGSKNTQLKVKKNEAQADTTIPVQATSFSDVATFLIDWLETQQEFNSIRAIGHRIVHGMTHTEPEHITAELLEELNEISVFAPEHLPGEIKLIELFQRRYSELMQIACFDTAFHTTMPVVAKLLPIPRKLYEMGIQRYGFHGLSYAYLMEALSEAAGHKAALEKVIIAHLGNGASLAAIKDGKSIDTSMGFTPSAGIPMGTRTGDLDPGIAWYLMEIQKLNAEEHRILLEAKIAQDEQQKIDQERAEINRVLKEIFKGKN